VGAVVVGADPDGAHNIAKVDGNGSVVGLVGAVVVGAVAVADPDGAQNIAKVDGNGSVVGLVGAQLRNIQKADANRD
jgi:hypothetical protein